jgi:hypothetical protein
MGIRDRPTSFRSPWQNGYAEIPINRVRVINVATNDLICGH